ncbi:MAG: DUF4394 domain-containing protein [Verrucomicrobiae bacterium]|nr:DUF4394 domain-containing protein [Verrucomicrobiae bacterium]
MKPYYHLRIILALGISLALPGSLPAQPILYGLTDRGEIVRFGTSGGEPIPVPAPEPWPEGEALVALDFRPLDGLLYGLSRDEEAMGRLYAVDPASGGRVPVPLTGAPLSIPGSVDMDFNPAALNGANALRVVTSEGLNYRLVFGADGATVNVDGRFNLPEGGILQVIATAYSNNRSGRPGGGGVGGTRQYALDAANNLLYRVNPPNDGTMTEPKPLGIEFETVGGLDIVTGSDRALAVLEVMGERGLYEIDLETGRASRLRGLPANLVDLSAAMPAEVPYTLVYGLDADGSLVSFTTGNEGTTAGAMLSGLGQGETPRAIDFRPFTAGLHLLTVDEGGLGRLYEVEVGSGVATAIPLSGAALTVEGSVDMDFNPAALNGINALRIITGSGQNYRLVFGAEGAVVNVDGAMNGTGIGAPRVVATAYSNNGSGLPGGGGAGGTRQFALDASTASLFRVNPPNDGTLIEPKSLGLEIGDVAALDIGTKEDLALAILDVGGERGLYRIDVDTGVPHWIRTLPGNVLDLAIPMPVRMTPPVAMAGVNSEVRWDGGVGPFAVLRADRVEDPFCTVATTATRAVGLGFEGPSGYFRIADLAGESEVPMTVMMSGAAERPEPVLNLATGTGTLRLMGRTLSIDVSYQGLSGPAVAAHLHGPSDSGGTAGVLIDLAPLHQGDFGAEGRFDGNVTINAEIQAALLGGRTYINVHTANHPGGEIRGTVLPSRFEVILSGEAERPEPVLTPALGFGHLALSGNRLTFDILYHGLTGPAVAAHFHGAAEASGTAGVLVDLEPFNGGAFGSSGVLGGAIDLTPDQLGILGDGRIYVNLHTAAHPAGELRGQLRSVPLGRPYMAVLNGAAERPDPVDTPARGFASFTLTGDRLAFRIGYVGLSGDAVAAHIHGPASASAVAGVLFDLQPFHRGAFRSTGIFTGAVMLLPEHRAALERGDLYLNVHTVAHPGGEIRGQIVSE